ncbi:hypothetical protein PRZ48_006024 [Zasmidium cellare]|uniref:Uncharacterized protein n=1 Tax=Zasmidium cellare TaxID=395010 RepID=A0ABR0EP57_ZASCE|nr:hypothetical protein PRZ48_006024 [Zasmidium cellare]
MSALPNETPNNEPNDLPTAGPNRSTPPPEPTIPQPQPVPAPSPPDRNPFLALETRPITHQTPHQLLTQISTERTQTLHSLSLPILLFSTKQRDGIPRIWLTEVFNSSGDKVLHVPVAKPENGAEGELSGHISRTLADETPARSMVGIETLLAGVEGGGRLVVLVKIVTEEPQRTLERVQGEGGCDGVWMAREDLERKGRNWLGDWDFVNEFYEEDLRREILRLFGELEGRQ